MEEVWVRDLRHVSLSGPGAPMSRRRSGKPQPVNIDEKDKEKAHAVLLPALPTDTVGHVKERVARRFDNVDPELTMLVFEGKELTNDSATLRDCGVSKHDTLYLRTTLRGLLVGQRDELAALGPLGARKEIPARAKRWLSGGRPPPIAAPPSHHISDWSARSWADPRRRVRSNARKYALQCTPGAMPPPRPARPKARSMNGAHVQQLRRLIDRVGNPVGLPGVDTEEVMRDAFDALDADGTGSIDCAEFEEAYLALDTYGAPQDRDTAKMFALADVNGDGRLSFDEFCLFVSRKMAL